MPAAVEIATSRATSRDAEVPAKVQRRQFTAEYRRRILREADACQQHGELGALLRREGSSMEPPVHSMSMTALGKIALISTPSGGNEDMVTGGTLTNRQRAAALLVIVSNTAAGWWLCTVTWLVMNLHVDDGIAARMTSNDWWLAAALRFAVACVAAAAMAMLLFGLNWVIVKSSGLAVRGWAAWPASLVAVLVLAVGLSGSIRFLIVRPWF